MSTSPDHVEMRPIMLARRYGWRRNQLRRRPDRIEAMVVLVALLMALIGVPAAAALGAAMRKNSVDQSAQLQRIAHPVQVTTLEAAPVVVPEYPQVPATVRASWQNPDGSRQEGLVKAAAGLNAGTELTLWMDPEGRFVAAPHTAAESAAYGAVAGLAVLTLWWIACWAAVALIGGMLDRWRSRMWQREWLKVSPTWTGQG